MAHIQYSLAEAVNAWAQHLKASANPFEELVNIQDGYKSKDMGAGLIDIYKVVDVSSEALAVIVVRESAQLSDAGIGLHVTLNGKRVWSVAPYGHR